MNLDKTNSNDNDRNLTSIKMDIGRNLFIARKALKLNHIELVELTGLTRPVISTIESGSSNPTLNSIIKLSTALCLSNEMLMMTGAKFDTLNKLLKQTFANYQLQESELHIPKTEWNNLIKYPEAVSRTDIGRIANICRTIVSVNYPAHEKFKLQNMTLGATLGVISQSDGFNAGLNFGAWLGENLCK